MSFSEAEARIRRLASRLKQAEYRVGVAQDQIMRTRQGIAGFLQISLAGPQGCTTTITGDIFGGNAAPIPGAMLQVIGGVSAIDYGTFLVSTGSYSIGLTLDVADTSLDLITTGPGSRFGTASPVNRAITQCTTNALAFLPTVPATGHHFFTSAGACAYPVRDSISFTGSLGSGVMTYSAISNASTFDQTWITLSTGPCPTSVSTILRVALATSSGMQSFFPSTGFCPRASATLTPPFLDHLAVGTIPATSATSRTCPGISNDFTITFGGTAGANDPIIGPGSWTVTFYET